MSSKFAIRSAAVGGMLVAVLASGGTALAASGQTSGGGGGSISTSGGGSATFTGSGYAPGSPITVTAAYCGTSKTFITTAAADGSFSLPATGLAGTVTFTASGKGSDGNSAVSTATAVISAACPAVFNNGGGGNGSGGGLPFTGFEAGLAGGIGLAAVGAGTVIVIGSRRRRKTAA